MRSVFQNPGGLQIRSAGGSEETKALGESSSPYRVWISERAFPKHENTRELLVFLGPHSFGYSYYMLIGMGLLCVSF